MSDYRNELLDRLIRIYGFENPIVIQFAEMCECYTESYSELYDNCLRVFVEQHEKRPIVEI